MNKNEGTINILFNERQLIKKNDKYNYEQINDKQ